MKRLSGKDWIIDWVMLLILLTFCALTLYPFLYTLSVSFSNPQAVLENRVLFFPVPPLSLEAYRMILRFPPIWIGYANTLFYATFGTAINLIVTILAAYPMSRKEFQGRKFMNIFVSITMFVSSTGTMIPLYLIVRHLGLLDTRLSLLIVFAAYPFFIIILRSFFESIPEEMIEAARIDGASEFTILLKVILPVSGAALATVGLYYLINRWNGYFWAMVFINDPGKHPLQVVLQQLIVAAQMGAEMDTGLARSSTNPEAVKYAAIVVSTLPIAIIYPFIQKYFVKGVTLGSVKG
ncbi:MAG: carbohydrate ABC transporter permease [Spirochaetales bacterium]